MRVVNSFAKLVGYRENPDFAFIQKIDVPGVVAFFKNDVFFLNLRSSKSCANVLSFH